MKRCVIQNRKVRNGWENKTRKFGENASEL